MGRPPSNGVPAFRFTPMEVSEMEAILRAHDLAVPQREILTLLADKFSKSAERSGKIVVQMKQVWNWFQNRRYALRAKLSNEPGAAKLSISTLPQEDPKPAKHVPQPAATVRNATDNSHTEFEAKSSRDGAWYDVATFLSHRYFETGDPDVLVRFSGFGAEEDEWVNVRKHIRQRSLPCESSECVVVLPGDLILCFQEGKEQALYFDAHVLDAQRRRHDVRGCRCRFLVRYDQDLSEEIVPLRKVCRRPETDYRLQQLRPGVSEQRSVRDSSIVGNTVRFADSAETMPKQPKAEENTNAPSSTVGAARPPSHHADILHVTHDLETGNAGMINVANPDADPSSTSGAVMSGDTACFGENAAGGC